MLTIFEDFREKLDSVMIKAFGRRVVLWGYGYSGRFLAWYAEYYHSIKMDFIIDNDWSGSIPYEFPLFRPSLFEFNYMDVKDAVVWLAVPEDETIKKILDRAGYVKNESYFNFLEVVYGKNYVNEEDHSGNIFSKVKTGARDVQFMEWLEYVYGCNLVTAINSADFLSAVGGNHSYRISTQKEIFPILDKCHCIPDENDGIFDFGCGKGGAMITFLDYGFKKVGGVEFEKEIYDIMISNFNKTGLIQNEGGVKSTRLHVFMEMREHASRS